MIRPNKWQDLPYDVQDYIAHCIKVYYEFHNGSRVEAISELIDWGQRGDYYYDINSHEAQEFYKKMSDDDIRTAVKSHITRHEDSINTLKEFLDKTAESDTL